MKLCMKIVKPILSRNAQCDFKRNSKHYHSEKISEWSHSHYPSRNNPRDHCSDGSI